ncbi:MAG: nuclear transport factor 2 family protein, partial [Chthoniobacterales bacterium]
LVRASDNSAIETKLKQMEDKWAAAQMEKDHGAATIGELLASDFHGVSPKGEMRDKAAMLERMKSETDTYTSATNNKMDVHVYSPDLATICGTSTEKGKDKDGKAIDRTYAWLDTWMQRSGKWECIASSALEMKK